MDSQALDNRRLGERLVWQRLISSWQLRRALSSQTRLRFAASLSVVLLTSVQKVIKNKNHTDEDLAVLQLIHPLLDSGRLNDKNIDIHYDPNKARTTVKTNGSICVQLPSSIGEFRFDNLRLKNRPGEGYENLSLEDIDLSGVVVSIRAIHQ